PEMRKIAANAKVPICVMHMQGTPRTMQRSPSYPRGVVTELMEWFEEAAQRLVADGVKSEQIILDPGIGFGKTVQHNLEILSNLSAFRKLGFPLMIGLSRKSFMSKLINKRSTELLSTSLALNTMCMLEGVAVIRVHDIKEHRDMMDVIGKLN
ncbi:MAG: hypothetical protein KR126chlam2_00893, partial [Chlamydiae bacterium]|nr:hypothetical protein [Chlamydiota bacterium]